MPKGVPLLDVCSLSSVTVPMSQAAIWVLLKAPRTMIDLSNPLSATKLEAVEGNAVSEGVTATKISLLTAEAAVIAAMDVSARTAEPFSVPTFRCPIVPAAMSSLNVPRTVRF